MRYIVSLLALLLLNTPAHANDNEPYTGDESMTQAAAQAAENEENSRKTASTYSTPASATREPQNTSPPSPKPQGVYN